MKILLATGKKQGKLCEAWRKNMPQLTLRESASVFGMTGMDQSLERDRNM